MVELGFVLALELAGLLLATGMIVFGVRPAADPALRRVTAALERAALAFLARERAGLFALAAVLGLGLGLFQSARSGVSDALLAGASLALGALACVGVASLAARVTARSAAGMAIAARDRLVSALSAGLRPSGALGLFAETASTLGALLVLFVATVTFGRTSQGDGAPRALAFEVALPAYCLGAALAAALLAHAAGRYRVAARAGYVRAFEAEEDPTGDDAKNPVLVADLVGHTLEAAAKTALFVAASAVLTAAVLFAARSEAAAPEAIGTAAALPLIVRSFALVGCASGTLAARAEEARAHGLAVVRSYASALAIALFGAAGASYWLEPARFPSLATVAALGFAGGAVGPLFALVLAGAGTRGDSDAAPRSAELDVVEHVARALGGAWLVIGVVLGAAVLAVGSTGETADAGDSLTALAVWTTAFLSLAPLATGIACFRAVARTARGVESLATADPDVKLRLRRLDELGQRANAVTETPLTGGAALAAFLVAGVVHRSSGETPFSLVSLALAGSLGAAAVIAALGTALRATARGTREVLSEVDRQLFPPRAPGGLAAREGHAPSYRVFEELCVRVARTGPLDVLRQAILPVLLGIGLGLVYRVGSSRLAALALATFVALAAVTAFGAALAVDGARATQAGARRHGRPERDAAGAKVSVGDALANIVSSAAGPAACSQALMVATLALCLLELLT